MMTKRDKELIDKLNGTADIRRGDKIRDGIKQKGYRLEDEIAILRKMLKCAFDLIVVIHGEEISDKVIAEFQQYFADVEKIKKEVDGA